MALSHTTRFAVFSFLLLFVAVFILMILGPTPTTTVVGEGASRLGFIRAADADARTISFDVGTMLHGKQAENAAIRAGICDEDTRSDCVPNDYFIENTSKVEKTIPVDPFVRVIMQTYLAEQTGRVGSQEITFETLAGLIASSTQQWKSIPFTISVSGTKVIKIEEMYVP